MLVLLQSCNKNTDNLPEAGILSFQFEGLPSQNSIISKELKTVDVIIPFANSVKTLAPTIQLTPGASVVPASKIPQDFSQPIYYVVMSAEGKKTTYRVSVSTEKQAAPIIVSSNKKTIEAGESLLIAGKHFGNNTNSLKVFLVKSNKDEVQIGTKLIDSTQIQLDLPQSLTPQLYTIKVDVKGLVALSAFTIDVQYPSPELISLSKRNILQGDTLLIGVKFVSDLYTYKSVLEDGKNKYSLPLQKNEKGVYFTIIPKIVPSGNYTIKLFNETTQKQSISLEQVVKIYEFNKPFISGILNPKESYATGESIAFKTINFDSFPARFYQIQFTNTNTIIVQNALYVKASNLLKLDLPATLKNGSYSLIATLIDSNNQEYLIEIDEKINVK
jgi:hypothetical protein